MINLLLLLMNIQISQFFQTLIINLKASVAKGIP